MTYGTPAERTAWDAYTRATNTRRRWYGPTLAAGLIIGVIGWVGANALTPVVLYVTVPLNFAPLIAWYLITVRSENKAAEAWNRAFRQEDPQ